MKSKEELNVIKEKIESLREVLCELTPEELKEVTGGFPDVVFAPTDDMGDDTRNKMFNKWNRRDRSI